MPKSLSNRVALFPNPPAFSQTFFVNFPRFCSFFVGPFFPFQKLKMTAPKALVLMVLGVTFIARFSIKILYIKAAIKVTLLVTWFSQTKRDQNYRPHSFFYV